jgi:glycosyltransferase involved in cell wall biosynthesis
MTSAEARAFPARSDACLVLEGTYPYVRGGVSTWVHHLISSLPDLRFDLVHIGPEPGAYRRRAYAPPDNVVALSDLYCRERRVRGRLAMERHRAARLERRRHASAGRGARVLDGIRRLHLEKPPGAAVLDDLTGGDLSVGAFLHGRASFALTTELYEALAPEASFLDFFWHFRSMHLPLVRLLSAGPPDSAQFHAVCTGYAGFLAAAWSRRSGRPMLLTEHGIYARERHLEIGRATWLRGRHDGARTVRRERVIDAATIAALRRIWLEFFRALARCAYAQASNVISLCEASRARQIADGAVAERTMVIPNGIDLDAFRARLHAGPQRSDPRPRVTVGYVGRVVHIKDVVTFIHACHLASREVALDVLVFGPTDEDLRYARRCRRLVARLELDRLIRFEKASPAERIYPKIDILVLTSFSEGQPLVILEAGAAGIPVVASDVGACRELIEGRDAADRRMGASGIVTRIAAPEETAAAIVRLAREPALRRVMGETGRRRVAALYQERATVHSYRLLYEKGSWPALAGGSSA